MQQEQLPEKSGDRRRARGIETRRLILQSAISSIAALGLSNTTLDRVAEMANVSSALVVFHFKSKNQLFKEVLEFLGKRYSEGWEAIVENGDGSTMEKLLDLIDYDVRFARENPKYVSTWHAFWGESKGNSLYHELGVPSDQRYEVELEKLLTRYIDEEGYDKRELPAITHGLSAMQFGLWVMSHLDPKPDDYETGLAAARLFLGNAFPNRPLPPQR